MPRVQITVECDSVEEAEALLRHQKAIRAGEKDPKPNSHGWCACPEEKRQYFSWGYGQECGRCGGRPD